MISWGAVILQLLKLISALVTWAQQHQLIKQGYDEAMAEVAREIFRKSEYSKRVVENVDAMSDEEVDAALVGLEPTARAKP